MFNCALMPKCLVLCFAYINGLLLFILPYSCEFKVKRLSRIHEHMANVFFVTNRNNCNIVCRGDGQTFTFYACDSISGIQLPVFDLVCSIC